jgi:hypothetical protein
MKRMRRGRVVWRSRRCSPGDSLTGSQAHMHVPL